MTIQEELAELRRRITALEQAAGIGHGSAIPSGRNAAQIRELIAARYKVPAADSTPLKLTATEIKEAIGLPESTSVKLVGRTLKAMGFQRKAARRGDQVSYFYAVLTT